MTCLISNRYIKHPKSNILFQAGSLTADADDEEQPAVEELDASDDEEAMEVDGKAAPSDAPMEIDTTIGEKDVVSEEAATAGAKGPAAPKPTPVFSGLPQNKDELESLISAIHETVKNSVLPRLHKCLTAKVRCTHAHTQSYVVLKTLNGCITVCVCVCDI